MVLVRRINFQILGVKGLWEEVAKETSQLLISKILVVWKTGCLQEVVTKGGLTILHIECNAV